MNTRNLKVMDARLRVLSEEEPETLTSKHNLVWTYWKEIEALQAQVKVMRLEGLGLHLLMLGACTT